MTATPDPALVHAFLREAGGSLNQSEFTRLYEANSRAIFGYVIAVTGRRDVAEDLVQETFCRVLAERHAARIGSMDANEARRYLFRVATNLVRDRWRSRDDTPATAYTIIEASAEISPETILDIRNVLAQLKPRQRELLWLAYVEGMNHAEIARAMGLAHLSVRILLYRARNEAKLLLHPSRVSL